MGFRKSGASDLSDLIAKTVKLRTVDGDISESVFGTYKILNEDVDASAAIVATKIAALETIGSYTGNATQNRAIAHGLSRVPKSVKLKTATVGNFPSIIQPATIAIQGGVERAVTIWDDTNFYVGNPANYGDSANGNGLVYHWVAE